MLKLCNKCKDEYELHLKDIIPCIISKEKISLCPDCRKITVWKKYSNACKEKNIYKEYHCIVNRYENKLFEFIYKFCERNRIYLNDKFSYKRPVFFKIRLYASDNILSGFPVGYSNDYIICREDIYDAGEQYGLHRIGEKCFSVPLYKIREISVFEDITDAFVPETEPIFGYKAVSVFNGVLKAHDYIYEINIPYEEERRNPYAGGFSECYSHFCLKMEDVIFCQGNTDYLTSQAREERYKNCGITKLFRIKAEDDCRKLTNRGWITNKLTLLEEVSKNEIIEYYDNRPEIKKSVLEYIVQSSKENCSRELWNDFISTPFNPYKTYYESEEKVLEAVIKNCSLFNSDNCLQNNAINAAVCESCIYYKASGAFNPEKPNVLYLILRYRITKGIWGETEEEVYHNIRNMPKNESIMYCEAIERLLVQYGIKHIR